MTFTLVLNLVAAILNLTVPQGFYNHKVDVIYEDNFLQPTIQTNDTVYYSSIDVEFDLELYFDEPNSYRLDFNSVNVTWNVLNYDSFPLTFDLSNSDISFNYDTIQTFVPRLTLSTDAEDDLLNVNLFNNGNLLEHKEIEFDLNITVLNSLDVQYDMTYFRNDINYYMNAYGDLSTEYINGYDAGRTDGYTTGFKDGEAKGYTDGFNKGLEVDETAIIIFNGILNIALVPVNFFLAIFNFEILGINVSQLVTALLSVCLVIIIVRFVTGKSQGGKE